jgi:NADH dehydrogenase
MQDPYPPKLQRAARRQLEELGVEIVLGHAVDTVTPEQIELDNGQIIPTYTLIWTAGVKASQLAESLDVALQKGRRVLVKPTLELEDDDAVYVIGDMAYLEDKNGTPYPMVIPVAQQQGKVAAQNIMRRFRGHSQKNFHYRDRGMMATTGRRRAVAWVFHKIRVTGLMAWISWLGLHLITLIGFRNRLLVLTNWVWNYLSYGRSAQIILSHPNPD